MTKDDEEILHDRPHKEVGRARAAKVHRVPSAKDTSKWYNCAHCDAGYPDQECTCKENEE